MNEFGPHLTIDLYKCSKNLTDTEKLRQFLDKLPGFIGMTKISDPRLVVHSGKPGSFDKGGVSGFIIIAESHISIHTFNEQKFASVDIFSCKQFDFEWTINFVKNFFGAKKIEVNLINRGTDFPKGINGAGQYIDNDRNKIAINQEA